MHLGELTARERRQRFETSGLQVRVPPFLIEIRTRIRSIQDLVGVLYASYTVIDQADYIDYRLRISRPSSHRRWLKPYAVFSGDGESPFAPLPIDSAFPLFEWGFNWRVATTAHYFLMLHAAAVERHGTTVLLPAVPGSGKSTLAAALMSRGWRLLSDEFGLVRLGGVEITPFPRPIPLKNESIELMRRFSSDATLGPTFFGTRKGDVAHLRPSRESVIRADETAPLTHVVFPRYEPNAPARFHELPKARAFLKLCGNAFNYEILGIHGFRTVANLIECADCSSFVYGHLADAIEAFDQMSSGNVAASA